MILLDTCALLKIVTEPERLTARVKSLVAMPAASTFHFCKMFKKATGMTFTHYLSLVRVTKAKQQLANPQLRLSEIAYEVGFNSLTHFNRMFRKLTGESPTVYRERILGLTARSGGR